MFKKALILILAGAALAACGGEQPSPYDPNHGSLTGALPLPVLPAGVGVAKAAITDNEDAGFDGTMIVQYALQGKLGSPDSGPAYWQSSGHLEMQTVGNYDSDGAVIFTTSPDGNSGLKCSTSVFPMIDKAAIFAKGQTSSVFPQSWAIAGTDWFNNKELGFRRYDAGQPGAIVCHFNPGDAPEPAKTVSLATFSDHGVLNQWAYLGILWDHGGYSYRAIFPYSYTAGSPQGTYPQD
jgi:hypothetical protein